MAKWKPASLLLAAAFCACDPDGAPPSSTRPVPAGPGNGILFVGNSLTYANDLPGLVEGLSAAIGSKLETAEVTYPDYGLPEHWQKGDAVRSIATGGWRVVILQQGPSTLDESREILRRYTIRFDEKIRAAGARTALYSVWPDSASPAKFATVAESYLLAASDVGGIYLPVTDAWMLARASGGSVRLYSSDGYHPSEQGSYLAALVIVAALTGRSPAAMPSRVIRPDGSDLSIAEEIAVILRDAAGAAIAAHPSPMRAAAGQ